MSLYEADVYRASGPEDISSLQSGFEKIAEKATPFIGDTEKVGAVATNALVQKADSDTVDPKPLGGTHSVSIINSTLESVAGSLLSSIKKTLSVMSRFFMPTEEEKDFSSLTNLESQITVLASKIAKQTDVVLKSSEGSDYKKAVKIATSNNANICSLNNQMSQYAKLIEKYPDRVSIDVIKKWTDSSQKINESVSKVTQFIGECRGLEGLDEDFKRILGNAEHFNNKDVTFGLASVPLELQQAMIKKDLGKTKEKFPEMEANYQKVVTDGVGIAAQDQKDNKSVQGGLRGDFSDRGIPSHFFVKTPEKPNLTELSITTVDKSKWDPLLTTATDCGTVIKYFSDSVKDRMSTKDVFKVYKKIFPHNEDIDVGNFNVKQDEILKAISGQLSGTVKEMQGIVGNNFSFQDKVDSFREMSNKVDRKPDPAIPKDSSSSLTFPEDSIEKTKAKLLLENFGFDVTNYQLTAAEETAYQMLIQLPNNVTPDTKSKILQAIRPTTTTPSQVILKSKGGIKMSDVAKYNVNVVIDDSGNAIIKHEAKFNVRTQENIDRVNDSTNQSWDVAEDAISYKTETQIDAANGLCIFTIKQEPHTSQVNLNESFLERSMRAATQFFKV